MPRHSRHAIVPVLLLVAFAIASPVSGASPAALPERPGWYASIDTSMGTIVTRLLPEQAPQAVAHFAALAEGRLGWKDPVTGDAQKTPFYDGIQVHRAEAGRHFEAGDRTGTGRSSPQVFVPLERGPVDFRTAGRMGMTRSPGNRISGAQFFITASAEPWLIRDHPCFGEVVSGLEVVLAISEVKTYSNGKPIEPVTIERVRIFAVGDPPALPAPVPYEPQQERLRVKPPAQP